MSSRRLPTVGASRKLPPSNRHRSALPKSSAAAPSNDVVLPDDDVGFHSKKHTITFEDESNIQVVIRCRRRTEREIQDASPVIVTTNGPRGEDVTIETAAPTSALGVVTLPPTRTYPFDRVFGPEADQAMVYNDVVAPMLEQVLMGYNCTVFAYGQTGTGKTYTMQGDLTPTQLGIPSAGAGMIPRVLFKLFQRLEGHVPDYSVKVSYIELYNEELRDLLASEMAVSSTQPMSNGSGQQAQSQGNSHLKIFEDASKRGVFIQGLEEEAVKDAADAVALLTKGSQRRQIAATKFNEYSSRSHSIFSITVHCKETSALGDDLLKVGKLNLVDLAGSENIGRSGAENLRAKEAGMINQSLLTLGRVINALVEKSSHVPYRESKLTRLLQDSLGGRTKTCIIAAVSPARCNLEETLSTLEYALRAKSIRNKPEVNQRLTKNALIKEYVVEVNRLKADLLASREMNGIYFSQESWDQMATEQELRQTQYEETKRKMVVLESQLNAVKEELDQSVSLLLGRESELNAVRETLSVATRELDIKNNELEVLKSALTEEVVVKEAHQKTENLLDGVAAGLKSTVQKTVEDIHGLFDKLGRISSVTRANVRAVLKYEGSVNEDIRFMITDLETFAKAHDQFATNLRASMQHFRTTESDTLKSYSSMIDEQFLRHSQLVEVIRSSESALNAALEVIQAAVKKAGEAMMHNFNAWSSELKRCCMTLCGEIEQRVIDRAATIEMDFKALTTTSEHANHQMREYIEQENKASVELGTLTREIANSEVQRLQQQNSLLVKLLRTEKIKSERARDELIQRISGLLGEYTAVRYEGLTDAVTSVSQSISAGESAIGEFTVAHDKRLEIGVKRRRDWEASMGQCYAECENAKNAGLSVIESAKNGIVDGFKSVQKNVIDLVTSQVTEMDKQAGNMVTSSSGAFEELRRIKRSRIDTVETLDADSKKDHRSLQVGLASMSMHIDKSVEKFVNEITSLDSSMESHRSSAVKHLSKVQQMTRSIAKEGTRDDISTGTTPRKRDWKYTDYWELTKPREELLHDWRERQDLPTSPESQKLRNIEEIPRPGSGKENALRERSTNIPAAKSIRR